MARNKRGKGNNNNNNNNNNRQNNNQRNSNQQNKNQRSGTWCTHCRNATHATADCHFKGLGYNSQGNKGPTPWGNNTIKAVEEDPKFRFCKFCKDFGHDLTTCKVLPKELKSAGIQVHQNGATGLFVPNYTQEDIERHFENTSKITKDYVNPFDKEKEQKNPFAILECTHSSSCRGLCGNKYYMAKSRELKRQLEETLGNMQLWLETLVPPEEDPYSMDWEAAPTIEIPKVQEGPQDPMRLWNPHREPVRMASNNPWANLPPKRGPVNLIDQFLKKNPFGGPPVRMPSFGTGGSPMVLDTDPANLSGTQPTPPGGLNPPQNPNPPTGPRRVNTFGDVNVRHFDPASVSDVDDSDEVR